jgi:hypothetical protein
MLRPNSENGDVAQLGERGVRNAEVRGSIPLISTKTSSEAIGGNIKPAGNSGFFYFTLNKILHIRYMMHRRVGNIR